MAAEVCCRDEPSGCHPRGTRARLVRHRERHDFWCVWNRSGVTESLDRGCGAEAEEGARGARRMSTRSQSPAARAAHHAAKSAMREKRRAQTPGPGRPSAWRFASDAATVLTLVRRSSSSESTRARFFATSGAAATCSSSAFTDGGVFVTSLLLPAEAGCRAPRWNSAELRSRRCSSPIVSL